MNIEIKFRGISKEKGIFLYGYYVRSKKENEEIHAILEIGKNIDCATEIVSDSVSQFTGITDKNGIEVYEGDIAIFSGVLCQVKWNRNFCGYTLNGTDMSISYWSVKDCKVIGNIYQNPYLLPT